MKLTGLSITNFRSIKKAQNIQLSDTTVLIGKNNEGKSNFLAALAICLNNFLYGSRHIRYERDDISGAYRYSWKRDFPVSLQKPSTNKNNNTIITLELKFSDKDKKQCNKECRIELPSSIQISTKFGRGVDPTITVSDKNIAKKHVFFRRFLSENISFIYIPAVRTPEQAKRVIDESIYSALSGIQSDERYIKAKQTIANLQKPVLKQIANSVKKQLSEFLPSIKDVRIELDNGRQEFSRWASPFDIIIDDGNPTSIDYKGDGVKSLAALGILKNSKKVKELSIIAIEEPESHLHPGAIKQLRNIIQSLKNTNQVVLSTHSPLFINKQNIGSNIIVNDKIARNAKNISEIRDVLGVVVDDNLYKAKYIIFVEGESDKRIFTSILSTKSKAIKEALVSGNLVIEALYGASKLSQMFQHAKTNLCDPYAIIDNDAEGTTAIQRALENEVLAHKDYTLLKSRGKDESELEDLIDPKLYKDAILKEFDINITKRYPGLNIKRIKWSNKMKKIFEANGKLFDSDTEKKLKSLVATCVDQNPKKAFLSINKPVVDSIILSLKRLLKQSF